jgi:tetratricopeptide (TPR) repeat protein
MSLFDLLYADDGGSLFCLVAIFYVVGSNMADGGVRRWGWRASAFGYVAFVVIAVCSVEPTRASQLAYIAYRGLFAGGLAVGTTWMALSVVVFAIRELENLEPEVPESPTTPQEEENEEELREATFRREAGDPPVAWKAKVRNLDELSPEAQLKYREQLRMAASFEQAAKKILDVLRSEAKPASPPPDDSERSRMQMQVEELRLAREHFSDSGADPQLVGSRLAECDARIKELLIAVGQLPPESRRPAAPKLAGVAMYDELVARFPKNPAARVERARRLIAHREFAEAIDECNRALDLLPTYHAAFNTRGCAYFHLKKFPAAVRNFERAIYENPSSDSAYVNLAAVYNAAGMYREALGPAFHAPFDNIRRHHQLAVAYENLQEHAKAVHHLAMVIQRDPNGELVPKARVRRAQQLMKLGQTELALHDLKSHLARKPDDDARRLLEQLEAVAAATAKARSATMDDGEPDKQDIEQPRNVVE